MKAIRKISRKQQCDLAIKVVRDIKLSATEIQTCTKAAIQPYCDVSFMPCVGADFKDKDYSFEYFRSTIAFMKAYLELEESLPISAPAMLMLNCINKK